MDLPVQPCSIDGYIDENSANANFGTSTWLVVGPSFNGMRKRGLLSFDFSSISAGAVISNAVLSLFYEGISGAVRGDIGCYRLTRTDWSELQCTWNIYKTGSAWTATGGDYTITDGVQSAPPALNNWQTWNVTNQVIYAQANTAKIAHFLIRAITETGDGTAHMLSYTARESLTTAHRPLLTITYTLPGGGRRRRMLCG